MVIDSNLFNSSNENKDSLLKYDFYENRNNEFREKLRKLSFMFFGKYRRFWFLKVTSFKISNRDSVEVKNLFRLLLIKNFYPKSVW